MRQSTGLQNRILEGSNPSRPAMRVRCIDNTDLSVSLTQGKTYEVLESAQGAFRLVDDTGGDYWFEQRRFRVIRLK